MAQGKDWKTTDTINEETGEATSMTTGLIMTFRAKYECLLEEFTPDSVDPFSQRVPTHILKVRAAYGEFVEAGRGWQGKDKNGKPYISVSMTDPEEKRFALFQGENNEWRASFN